MNNEEHTQPVAHAAPQANPMAIPVAIIIAGGLIAAAVILGGSRDGSPAAVVNAGAGQQQPPAVVVDKAELAIRSDDHIRGNANADVVLLEWSDLECPFCKRHHDSMNQLMKDYEGKVQWVYRSYPLDFHTYSKKESEAAECANEIAGAEGFWKFVDTVFSVSPGNNALDRAKLDPIAKTAGIDAAKFSACLDSGKMAGRVQKDIESGARAGVQGTPFTVAFNKKTGKQTVINGALPLQAIKAQLAQVGL
ncbi:MAG TPA: thioredoxin domain-containing protein [Candidatus Paceibacterota bacterium]|nr:thioredoxin domain-containing protein [Candidatus Paceibacterota bacterium]